MRIGIVHPGAMGAEIGASLTESGRDAAWASTGRSSATARRAVVAALEDLVTPDQLAAQCDVIVSLCPPADALTVARQFATYGGVYVDANAVSPQTSASIRSVVGRATYVDGAVIGPPPVVPGTTRMYLSGTEAESVAALLGSERLETRVLSGETSASALKMTYAAWTKGTTALLISIRAAAKALGVEDELLAEWALSQPEVPARSDAATVTAIDRGWRWSSELAEVGRTFAATGQPEGFGAAAAVVFGGFSRPAAHDS